MPYELADCTRVLLDEVASKKITQKSLSLTYAMALASSHVTDWAKVNEAIVSRWSLSGLERIKNAAWKLRAERN
jgi:hypothetical protein